MLSYRHAFHAGNHADVLKHLCLLALLERLTLKPKPLCYFETHAGAGLYPHDSDAARKTGERARAADRLLRHTPHDPLLRRYILALQAAQPDYPGSPVLALDALRADDELQLCELHPADGQSLQRHFRSEPHVHVHQRDGHEAVRALLPPTHKRGLVLIDPAYEIKTEYAQCAATVEHLRKHFRAACIALWYPRLPRDPASPMLDRILGAADADCLHITLDVSEALGDYGMYRMLIIQPPWQLAQNLEPSLREAGPLLSPATRLKLSETKP